MNQALSQFIVPSFVNLDLFSVCIAVAAIGLLGYEIYANNPKSVTNRAFAIFAAVTICWSVVNYINYQVTQPVLILWLLRLVIFFGVWHAFSFFRFLYVFPSYGKEFPRWHRQILIPWIAVIATLTLSPFVFSGMTQISDNGMVSKTAVTWGIFPFIVTVIALILSGLVVFVRRMLSVPNRELGAYRLVLVGAVLTFLLLFTFNLILPGVFLDVRYIPFGAVFLLPFIVLTSYAIHRYHLFDLKVATTALLGFLVTVFSFVNILYSSRPSEVVINVTAFLIVLLGSIKIVKDTLNLKELASALSETNGRQEGLIHFIGHEVKGFLTKAQGALSMLVEGDFGALPQEALGVALQALHETQDGVTSVSEILKAANLKRGTVEFHKEQFDLKALAAASVEKARSAAQAKGLALSFSAEEGDFTLVGDAGEIGSHVLRNLIDNAINYTPSGSIEVSLRKVAGRYLFVVKDTGIGISEDDRARLFTEGGHGKDSQRINVHSTGYGLFIVKQVVEDHGGVVRAESDGPGKGSTFIAEFPAS